MDILKKSLIIEDELRDYQKKYYDKLVTDDLYHALVCIPTGGGKTRLAVIFLIKNAIKNDKKVLWIAHSQYLLNQAYDTFSQYLTYDWMNNYSILIHSGEHETTIAKKAESITESHRLIICSFQSLQRTNSDWKNVLGNNVVIVVDEAHHIVAPSYIGLLRDYMVNKTTLGLTATPIRMKKKENSALYEIFDKDLGVRIHMTELFEKKYLVRPLFEVVNYSTEQLEKGEINTIDELDAYLVENSIDYNQRIFDKYKENEEKYGKTVIFAINRKHADSLYELFCENYNNNRVFLVYSNLKKTDALTHFPYGEDRESQFNAYKESPNGILININVLNEGVDIPDIRTVFLTKSLNSKTAVTQIIGRALRPLPETKINTTKKNCAYIVNFAVSNLGKKLLMIMPKTIYNQYSVEWESDKIADEYEKNEDRIAELSEMVEKVKKKIEICSFSDICLAGNYTIIGKNEKEEFPVPVSFNEYRKIERYRNNLSYEKSTSFPKRLFFCDFDTDLVKKAFQNESKQYDIIFRAYDSELLKMMEELLSDVTDKIKIFYETNQQRQQYEILFALKYKEIKEQENATLLWYLDQVGIRTERDFVCFMRLELPIIKRQIKEDMF